MALTTANSRNSLGFSLLGILTAYSHGLYMLHFLSFPISKHILSFSYVCDYAWWLFYLKISSSTLSHAPMVCHQACLHNSPRLYTVSRIQHPCTSRDLSASASAHILPGWTTGKKSNSDHENKSQIPSPHPNKQAVHISSLAYVILKSTCDFTLESFQNYQQ